MKKILITGGFGFLGTCLNKQFETDKSYRIQNISRRTGCDLRNLDSIKTAIEQFAPDIIINCAANVGSVNYVSEFAADIINDNLLISTNLYKAVADTDPSTVVINPLANCSYPSNLDIQNEWEWWNGEIHQSVESFGMSKKALYTISQCYKKQYGIQTVNLMLGGGFGEYDHVEESRTHAMNGIILRMIKAQKENASEFIVWGTGSPVREWVYMPDVARIIKIIADTSTYELPNPLNIGQQAGLSIAEIANLVKDKLQFEGKIVYNTDMQDGAPIKVLGSSLFRKEFPDFEFTNFDTAIKNTITYYINLL